MRNWIVALDRVEDVGPLTTTTSGMLWRPALLGAAVLNLLFGFANWLRTNSTRVGLPVYPVSDPALEVLVATDVDRSVALANRVPLVSGDQLRLTGFIPAKRAALVVAFSPNGNSRVVAQFDKQDKARRYQSANNPGKALPLVGPGGTEIIALVTADSEAVLNRVMTQIERRPTPWALIPEATALVWRNDEFMCLQPTTADVGSLEARLAGRSRNLGDAVDINPALTKLSDQFRKLAASLNREGVEIDAVAFRHLDSESGD